ncbi:hypothetical protein Salat_2151900 [Sesamum alatum]|uniref:Uncharacterized protein n=1 Tax=Sesamum alatum TaxID=300844 RepID=A0AAE2CH81_9LAMI|nr:hypothetical protein Salat_2151900 [Sesamum alatum]
MQDSHAADLAHRQRRQRYKHSRQTDGVRGRLTSAEAHDVRTGQKEQSTYSGWLSQTRPVQAGETKQNGLDHVNGRLVRKVDGLGQKDGRLARIVVGRLADRAGCLGQMCSKLARHVQDVSARLGSKMCTDGSEAGAQTGRA